jgi:cytochrome c oxidase assembly protein subunit 20
VPKAANWAFGGFLAGCVMSFEYCQWKRRQERVNMRRAVEIYQDNLAEKHRQEYEERVAQQEQAAQAAQAKAESAKSGSWYKFW